MKRLVFISLLALSFLFTGCELLEPPTAHIRFQNIMSDQFTFHYGLKMGEAVYEGTLAFGQSTKYFETSPGRHSLQVKLINGSWITITSGSFNVVAGKDYTMSISGTIDITYFQLIED